MGFRLFSGLFLSCEKSCVLIWNLAKKWAGIQLGVFSQTDLVTLIVGYFGPFNVSIFPPLVRKGAASDRKQIRPFFLDICGICSNYSFKMKDISPSKVGPLLWEGFFRGKALPVNLVWSEIHVFKIRHFFPPKKLGLFELCFKWLQGKRDNLLLSFKMYSYYTQSKF
jgi:hypothetical protein